MGDLRAGLLVQHLAGHMQHGAHARRGVARGLTHEIAVDAGDGGFVAAEARRSRSELCDGFRVTFRHIRLGPAGLDGRNDVLDPVDDERQPTDLGALRRDHDAGVEAGERRLAVALSRTETVALGRAGPVRDTWP